MEFLGFPSIFDPYHLVPVHIHSSFSSEASKRNIMASRENELLYIALRALSAFMLFSLGFSLRHVRRQPGFYRIRVRFNCLLLFIVRRF